MPERLRSFDHDGLRFDVVDDGPADGELVIALHGFPQTARSWADVTPVLTAAGYRVLAPDQRGYSRGARPTGVDAYRIDALAGDVLALADVAGAGRVHLLGHDWGGGVAWYLAARHPDRVETLSVASTPHPRALLGAFRGPQALRSWYMLFFQIPWLPERVLGLRAGVVTRDLMARTGAPHPEDGAWLLADPAAATAALNWYRAMARNARRLPQLEAVPVPTLYVWSDGDPALGRQAAEATAEWVSGPYRFEVLSGVSHWIPEERPEELADLVLEHLRACPMPKEPRPI